MGLLRSIKKSIVKKSMDKRKRENPFDIEYSDRYELPDNAPAGDNNSHYFFMSDIDTGTVVFFRLARRAAGATTELWMMLRLRNGDIYLQEHDHVAFDGDCPASVSCVTAGKEMRFSYHGNMIKALPADENLDVFPDTDAPPVRLDFEGVFRATGELFEFSTHMASETMANAMSKEKFSKSFQDTMRKIHQVHYEQAGVAEAVFTLDGKAYAYKDCNGMRDHSYGRRDWNYFDRYIWSIMTVGRHGAFCHTSMMRYPALSNLQAGFIEENGSMNSLYEATPMDEVEVSGRTPKAFSWKVRYIDGTEKTYKAKKLFAIPYLFDADFLVNEGVCEFEVDGQKGLGIGEFAFCADPSRWQR